MCAMATSKHHLSPELVNRILQLLEPVHGVQVELLKVSHAHWADILESQLSRSQPGIASLGEAAEELCKIEKQIEELVRLHANLPESHK